MVYSIFDRISDALITTYLTQLVLINCVCVIRYFSKKNQFESSILAKSKSFLFLYFDSSTPKSTQNCFFRNPKCSDSLQSIPMIVSLYVSVGIVFRQIEIVLKDSTAFVYVAKSV